jgi:hypothetical protein
MVRTGLKKAAMRAANERAKLPAPKKIGRASI